MLRERVFMSMAAVLACGGPSAGPGGPAAAPVSPTPQPAEPATVAGAVRSAPAPAGDSVSLAGPAPAAVTAMLADIDAARLRADVDRLAGFGTRHTLSDTTSETRGIGAARRWLLAELQRAAQTSGRTGELAMTADFDAHRVAPDGKRIDREVEVVNVVAVLPGSMPEARRRRYYVLGHYDSRASDAMDATSDAPGANDDGSGTALVLELARVMAPRSFDATLVFLATAGEEQGLIGARRHAEAARAAGLEIAGALSNDIVGDPSDPRGGSHRAEIRLFSEGVPATADPAAWQLARQTGGFADAPSRQLARLIADVAALHELPVRPRLVFRPDRFLRGGDHTAFNEQGFAAVRFTEVAEDYDRQHQDVREEAGRAYGDLPAHVDAAYLADVARLNAAALAHLANAPSPPGDPKLMAAELTGDTTLRWTASPEPDVAGYEVLRRATSAPAWEHAVDVGPVTEATLPFSKDDWLFAVRAYDRDGYRSPAAFPRVARE
ncbi:M20/M25/M40 family metallo-hydrolase [Nannocystis punicea]|uniref:M20/M25/M40 family metallo-hydrolase n=1 Tax=Nannocystis punicea TaxID=2995304 RepID=A0ABY7GU20_9BACT|nr:M20/M25/M40 family metallo-hydrolase [Nannocystis poenicansa]WAS90456.1 M20/M25/M40 family metallo-hydrolase [Nannocystis poenicansa]